MSCPTPASSSARARSAGPGRRLGHLPGLGRAERVELAGVAVRRDDRDPAVDQAPGQRGVGVPVGVPVGVQRRDGDGDHRGEGLPQVRRGGRGEAHGFWFSCDSGKCCVSGKFRATKDVMWSRSRSRRALGVAVVGGHEHGLMLGRLVLPARGRQPAGFAVPGGHADQGGLIAQVIEHADQQRVAAAGVELAVEVAVGQAASGLVGGAVGAGQGLVRGSPVVAPGHGARHGLGLEQQAGVVDVPGLLVVDDAHGRALVRAHGHQPGAGQGLERLADRGLGHAEHLGQVGLDQRLARLELSGQDRVLDRVEHGHRARREGARAGQDQIRSRHHVPRLIYDV